MPQSSAAGAVAPPAPPARRGATALGDGRLLAWAEWGAPDHRAVLLCPGAATSRSLGFGADLLDRHAIRLISVDRPGLGGSDPAPQRTLPDWAADVDELAGRNRWRLEAAVGFSQGAPFALACARAGLLRAAALVSGTDELARPALRGVLAPDVRRLVELVADAPEEALDAFRAVGRPEVMEQLLDATAAPVDRAVYRHPAFRDAWRASLREALRPGPDGYARDAVLTFSLWPFDAADVATPVDLWYGEHDTSPVHSPDLGAELARRLPRARRHLVRGAGGALLWTHAAQVLDGLAELLAAGAHPRTPTPPAPPPTGTATSSPPSSEEPTCT